MATLTTRLGLTKPAGVEFQDVDVLNDNADDIDARIGAIMVNDTVVPTSLLFDGAIVKERTSGIAWIASDNGAGGWNKQYLKFPGVAAATSSGVPFAVGSTPTISLAEHSFDSFTGAAGVNQSRFCHIDSSAPASGVAIDLTGLYDLQLSCNWQAEPDGVRALCIYRNDAPIATRNCVLPPLTQVCDQVITIDGIKLGPGDKLNWAAAQTSGGNLNITGLALSIKLVHALP